MKRKNGKLALEQMAQTNIDVLFLDLTMPVMDGFEVLASLPVNNHPTKVIIVSGDIQAAAKQRCRALGALDFIEKNRLIPLILPSYLLSTASHFRLST
ncbi:response regulator [Vibrio sinaloensis]|nr:response regulator [Vibrio sinaloensis]